MADKRPWPTGRAYFYFSTNLNAPMTRYIPEINAVGLTTSKALGEAGEPREGSHSLRPTARLARFLIELNRQRNLHSLDM